MLSHSTRVRNFVRSAYLRTEFELNGLRGDAPVPRRGPRDGTPPGHDHRRPAKAESAARHRGAA